MDFPTLQAPDDEKKLFEIRTYMGYNEDAVRRKISMFNNGEIDIFLQNKFTPVFYSEDLIGENLPCLTYMLAFKDMEERDSRWKDFGSDPDWKRMSSDPAYANTVSRIIKVFLEPLILFANLNAVILTHQSKEKISLRDAISIGIGGMVGGGIFAVLGLSVALTRGGAPLAFLFAGIIALATSYAYARLSLSYPGNGGTVNFINQAYGKNIFSGGLNNLLWVSYIVMLSLYATAFSSYAPNILSITGELAIDKHIYATLIILIAAGINYYSVSVVGKIESYSVIAKLIILIAFVFIGAWGLFGNANISQLEISNWKGPIGLITGGMVIFVAYEGFELIANAAPNILDPEKNIPRSYYISVGFVIVLYILIATITVGSLPFHEIAKAKDYALAEAAKPMLGQAGFTIITIAALISTFSAINASLYGGSRVSYKLGIDDEDPHELTKFLWNKPIGLVFTTVFTLLLVNTVNLESIATSGSVGFLLIFAFVNLAAYRLSGNIGANRAITFIAFILCLVAMIVLIIQQFSTNRTGIIIALGIILFCFAGETVFKLTLGKTDT